MTEWKAAYNMDVQEPWFSEINKPDIKDRKTVEGRVGKEHKHDYLLNKIVKVVSDNNYLFVRVTRINHYDTLVEYLQAEGWKNVAPQASSYIDALERYSQIMTEKEGQIIKVFSDKRIEEEGGINALHLELLSSNNQRINRNNSTSISNPSPSEVNFSNKRINK